jgi:WD40 repeat protein
VIVELRGHQGLVISAAFSPDGRRVVTASTDNTARVWDIAIAYFDSRALLSRMSGTLSRLGRTASLDECKLYFSSPIGARPKECKLPTVASKPAPKK